MTVETVIVWSVPILGFVLVLSREIREREYLLALRRESSRFELFALRDELVAMVAREEVSEKSAAWSATYKTVNRLLCLDQKLDVHDVLRRMVRVELEKDETKEKRRRLLEALQLECDRSEAFRRITEQLSPTVLRLAHRRTTSFGWFQLRFYVFGVVFLSFGVMSIRKSLVWCKRFFSEDSELRSSSSLIAVVGAGA